MVKLNFTSATKIDLENIPDKWRENIKIAATDNGFDVELKIDVEDSSYRYRALMTKAQLNLKFSLPYYIDIPVGATCLYEGMQFRLNLPENLKRHGKRNIEYNLLMGTEEELLGLWKLRNSVDGRLKFSMTAKPHEFIDEIIANLNKRNSEIEWSRGSCIESSEKTVEFNHVYIDAALTDVANTFETEYEISIIGNKGSISLGKVEHFVDMPLPLSYGKGNGFVPGIGRISESDDMPVKRMYVQGTDRNIDRSKYPSPTLLLPINQELEMDGRRYRSDKDGCYIERVDRVTNSVKEDSADCSQIYPSRIGEVGRVEAIDAEKHLYDIIDPDIPDDLDFDRYIIAGETMTIRFEDGMLAGKEFDVKYRHDERRFEIVPQEIDGITMPDEQFCPVAGTRYGVFGIMLPDAYICDNKSKTGASWDMFREAARLLSECEEQKFTFSGELQSIWAKRNWENIGSRLVPGGYVLFSDDEFAPDGTKIRITGIKDYINSPYSPTIELSHSVNGGTFGTTLREIANTEVKVSEARGEIISYTKRRFRDALETVGMLVDAKLENFTDAIQPIAVQTMSVLVGDESLQYRFITIDSNHATERVGLINYDNATKTLKCNMLVDGQNVYLQHMTLGQTDLTTSDRRENMTVDDYEVWPMQSFVSAPLTNVDKRYYLYARVNRADHSEPGEFVLSETAIAIRDEPRYYHLLTGIINSELAGERSFVTLYGFTEILPGRVTTGRVVSSDGESWFDLEANSFKLGNLLMYNVDGSRQMILHGVMVQSNDGETVSPVGCYRGRYNPQYTYYNGDEVTWAYAEEDPISTYRCISQQPVKGIDPEDMEVWEIVAQGVKGSDGISPNASYKSTAFIRSSEVPRQPSGGDYNNPVPDGWSDGIPAGDMQLWASTRIFTTDGKAPQQDSWSIPRAMTDTADFDVEFSSVDNPSTPVGHPNTNKEWSNESSTDSIWMATSTCRNGIWSEWQISRIKGENGQDGSSVTLQGEFINIYKSREEYGLILSRVQRTDLIDHDEILGKDCIYAIYTPPGITTDGERIPGGTTYTVAKSGDCWVKASDGHIYMPGKGGWRDMGQFRGSNGEDGTNAFLHIKYATSEIRNSWTSDNGETPGPYIGVYCDDNPADTLDWDLYTWTKWRGEDGNGYEYIYCRTQKSTAPRVPVSTSDADGFIPSGWTDNPTGVDENWPYEWLCYRKKTDGVWGAFTGSADDNKVAALWAKYGKDANYTEYRYCGSGSPTIYPDLVDTDLEPAFWSTEMDAGGLPYLWMTMAVKSADGLTLVKKWSKPLRITGVDGKDGAEGKHPVVVYRGEYNPTTKYYGNDNRLDVVKYGTAYYIALINAGEFSNVAPVNASKWNQFGASFDSVATSLMLAEQATIGNWFIYGDKIASTHGTVNEQPSNDFSNPAFRPDIILDGATGEISMYKAGYPRLRICNSSIGTFYDASLVKEAVISSTGTRNVSPYIATANTSYRFQMGVLRTEELGQLNDGSVIRISDFRVSFTVPSHGGSSAYPVQATVNGADMHIHIKRNGVTVHTLTGASGVSRDKGASLQIGMSGSYTIPTNGEGNYTLELVLDYLYFNTDHTGVLNTFNLQSTLNGTFTHGGFNRTIIGNDGIGSFWENATFVFCPSVAFVVRFGNIALKVSENGIQSSSNATSANPTWKTIS